MIFADRRTAVADPRQPPEVFLRPQRGHRSTPPGAGVQRAGASRVGSLVFSDLGELEFKATEGSVAARLCSEKQNIHENRARAPLVPERGEFALSMKTPCFLVSYMPLASDSTRAKASAKAS